MQKGDLTNSKGIKKHPTQLRAGCKRAGNASV